MHKLLVIGVILILPILIGGGLFLVSRSDNGENLGGGIGSLSGKILGVGKVEEKSEAVVESSKSSLQKKIQNQADNLNQLIESQADNLVSTVLGKKVEKENSNQSTDLSLDLKNEKGKQLNLKKGVKYNLKVGNVSDGFCIFVDEVHRPLSDGSKITVQFETSGVHSVKVDFCQPGDKNFGQLLVE